MPRARRAEEEILRRPDPQGYYVVPLHAPGPREAREALELARRHGAEAEQVGDVVLLRVKGRAAARRLLEEARRRGLRLAY